MSATLSNFDGPEFFNKNLKDLKNNADMRIASRAGTITMQATTTDEP